MSGPLEGIRVVELTTAQQGPVAGARLGDMGARVVKVESAAGDPFRNNMKLIEAEAGITGFNYYFEHANRNKRSVVLNLKSEAGREAFLRLIDDADVFITNTKIDVPQRLGIGPDALLARNPRLVYAHASGWGRFGDYAKNRAYDQTGIARGGLMFAAGDEGTPPACFLPGLGDEVGAIVCGWGVTAALLCRERTGKGQVVDTSLLGSVTALVGMCLDAACVHGAEYPRGSRERARNAVSNHYRCSDGKWIAFAHMDPNDKYWEPFCDVIGLPESVKNDPDFRDLGRRAERAEELVHMIDERTALKTREEWLALCERAGLIAAPVQTLLEVARDPQAIANGYIIDYEHPEAGTLHAVGFPWSFSETPASVRRSAPALDEHTDEILAEYGYSPEEIAALRSSGAAGVPKR